MTPDLAAQIACKVYPRLVQQGKMTPPQAQHELLTLQAVLQTLQRLQPQQEEVPYAKTPD